MCCDSLDMNRNDKLKAVLNEYFDSQSLEETGEVPMVTEEPVRPSFFFVFFYRFFSKQVGLGGQNKIKIHSDHFPIELKSKVTRNCVSFDFNSIGKWSE